MVNSVQTGHMLAVITQPAHHVQIMHACRNNDNPHEAPRAGNRTAAVVACTRPLTCPSPTD
jgi:hypothetical protein